MALNPRHFLRMSTWARRPPGARRVKLVIGVILACLLLYGIEALIGFPDWLAPERLSPR